MRPAVPRALLESLLAGARAARRSAKKRSSEGPEFDKVAEKAKIKHGQRLIQRVTMGWTLAEQAVFDDLGYKGYLERQLDPESIDDFGLEEALQDALPTLAMSPAELIDRYENNPGVPIFELIVASIYRSIYSPRGLYERMIHFWSDHFTVHLLSGIGYLLKPTDDRDVIRANALGTFPELLSASAHSPAMLIYLTNDSNVFGHPNENYARELMELHTMGADRSPTTARVWCRSRPPATSRRPCSSESSRKPRQTPTRSARSFGRIRPSSTAGWSLKYVSQAEHRN